VRALGLPIQVVFDRPRYITASSIGYPSLSAVDVTTLFIFLEQCGFAVDPSRMVDAVLPSVRQLAFMTRSEVEVYG
jgi:hypothetical protein